MISCLRIRRAPCPERDADRQLALPRRSAHEQQIPDVGAREQQDKADGAQEHKHLTTDVRPEDPVLEGNDASAPIAVRDRIFDGELSFQARRRRRSPAPTSLRA